MKQQSNLERKVNLIITLTGLVMMATLFAASGWFLRDQNWVNAGGFAFFGLLISYTLLRDVDE